MLIERMIELQLRGLESPGRTCTPITGYFHDKTKISTKNLRVDYYLLLKCCKRQCILFFPPGPNLVQLNFNTKMQDVKRVLYLNCK